RHRATRQDLVFRPSRCFLGRLRFFPARLGCRLFLRASLLKTSLQDGNQINYLGRLWHFLRFFFDLFSASFDFFFDHFHERFTVVVAIFFWIPFRAHTVDE